MCVCVEGGGGSVQTLLSGRCSRAVADQLVTDAGRGGRESTGGPVPGPGAGTGLAGRARGLEPGGLAGSQVTVLEGWKAAAAPAAASLRAADRDPPESVRVPDPDSRGRKRPRATGWLW